MRICLVHSFYRSATPSGENEIVLAQQRALRTAGHEVRIVGAHSDDVITGSMATLGAAVAVARRRGRDPGPEIDEFRPDVVHVHNLFPNFGYQWLDPLSKRFPIIATLHNYRHLCAKGTLYRSGATCEACLGGPLPALRHRCYRDSVLATLPLAIAQRGGVAGNPLFVYADRTIALTKRSAQVFQRAGADMQRMVVIPNGIEEVPKVPGGDAVRWLYAGRLSEEKGILELLAAWPPGLPLDVVGNGPLLPEVQACAADGVNVRGPLARKELCQTMSSYRGLVVPSRWAEGFPLVVGEALSAGTPVLALAGSGAADFIDEFGGGLVYTDSQDLRDKVAGWDTRTDRVSARTVFEENLSERVWVQRLTELYAEVAR